MAKLKCLNCGEIFSVEIKDHEHVVKPCPKCKSKFVKYLCPNDVEVKEKTTITRTPNTFDFNKFMSAFTQQ